MFIMIAGVGVSGASASLLASVLVGGGSDEEAQPAASSAGLDAEVGAIRTELSEVKAMLERTETRLTPPPELSRDKGASANVASATNCHPLTWAR